MKLTDMLKRTSFWNKELPKTPFPKSIHSNTEKNVVTAATISNGGGSGTACSPG